MTFSVEQKKCYFRFFCLIFTQISILIYMIFCNRIFFATNDDTTMVALAGGGYGAPSEYIDNMHILLGYVFKFLFTRITSVNWVTVYYIFGYVVSVFLLDFALCKKKIDNSEFLLSITIIDISFFVMLNYFTFTTLAYWMCTCGLVVLTTCLKDGIKRNKILFIFSIILFTLGIMTRGEVVKSLAIIFLLYSFSIFYKTKKFNNFVILFFSLIFMFAGTISNLYISNRNDTQKKFLEWGEMRSSALDCQVVPYDEKKFGEYEISATDYNCIYNAFYYDYDVVSYDNMKAIKKLNVINNKYNLDLISIWKTHIGTWKTFNSFYSLYFILFWILVLLYFILGEKEQGSIIFSVIIGTIITEFIFRFIQRALYRVIMPNYIFSAILMIFMLQFDSDKLEKIKQNKISLTKMFCLLISAFILFVINIYIKDIIKPYNIRQNEESQEVLSYMDKNSDKLFLAGDFGVFAIGISESIWSHPGKRNGWNLIGNWETYSVPYFKLLNKYNINDKYHVLKESINSNNIRVLTRYGSLLEQGSPWIIETIREKYGIDAQLELECVISEGEHEIWAAYKIVN